MALSLKLAVASWWEVAYGVWRSPFAWLLGFTWHSSAVWLLVEHGALLMCGCSCTLALSLFVAAQVKWHSHTGWLLG